MVLGRRSTCPREAQRALVLSNPRVHVEREVPACHRPIRIVHLQEMHPKLHAARTDEILHTRHRWLSPTSLESRDRGLCRARTPCELDLRQARSPSRLPDDLSAQHPQSIAFLLSLPQR